jgi:uncharacterized damage-inducible protein DinB
VNLQDLTTMLEYHYWARDRLLDALEPLSAEQYTRDLGSSFKSIRDTATHLYAAEWAWYERWQGRSPTALIPSDRFADLAALRAAWTDNERRLRAYIDGLDDTGLTRVIEYKLLSGTAGSSQLGQMVQHIVNHASYHRGQITTMLRQIGMPPPKPLDMIAFFRTRS